MFERKHPITTEQALESGIIERYWNRGYRRYFYAYNNYDGFDTASEALDKYYEIQEERRKEERERIFADLSNKMLVCKDVPRGTIMYWTKNTGRRKVPIRKYRQEIAFSEEFENYEVCTVDAADMPE